MTALLALHVLAAAFAPWLVHRLGSRAFLLLAAVPASAFAWALAVTGDVRSGDGPRESVTWVPSLGAELSLRLDTLGWLMVLVVGGVGALVLLYCAAYFDDAEVALGRFAASLVAFAGAMLGLVVSDDMLVLYLFWELTTVLSYLLIGHLSDKRTSRAAAMQALVVTTAGGLAMLVGVVVLGQSAGTYSMSELFADPPTGAATTVAVVLLLAGAVTKSALVPFHFWLPGAMAAPTPVSAYLHAAAMVKAGVYLVARFAPAFADTPLWRPVVIVLGATTMVLGGWRALRQTDLKLLLAFGTVSQLGFLVTLVGAGTRDAALAGLTLLVAHALFKACLFLVVGAIDHSTGTRDLRRLTGLRRSMPVAFWASALALASMAGLPPMLGFVGKEAAYTAFLASGTLADGATLAVLVAGSALTFAYGARFLWGAFLDVPGREPTPVHRPGWLLLGPSALLAGIGLVAGPLSPAAEPMLTGYTQAWPQSEHPAHLGLWHGLGLPLLLSAVSLALGAGLFLLRSRVEAAQQRLTTRLDADTGYRVTMRALDRVSLEVTGALQRGSLPLSLGLIFVVLVVLPGGAVLLHGVWPDAVRPWDNAGQVVVAVITAVAAVWTARSRRRLRAAILVGVVGYGTAMLFLLHGAPDLALTQVLVETVTLVVFVLVLRRLPAKFSDTPPGLGRWVRVALGTAVGVVVTGLALTSAAVRTAVPASEDFAEGAVGFGGGYNIVNVTLVDIRAWDTMGELSVILVAATGVASLVFLRERHAARHAAALEQTRSARGTHAAVGGAGGYAWLAGVGVGRDRRSVIFEVVTRLVFHTIVLYSLYLLFSGHNNPGGGFAAGLVVGLALAVRYLAGGRDELKAAAPVMPGWLLGTGLFLSAGTGLVSILLGGDVLQSWILQAELPLLGDVKLVTSLFFDVGVYVVVLGLMLDVLRSLGGELDVQIAAERGEDDDPFVRADTGGPA
ncbi:Na+/H+ antiporter subunit A [Thalassiella azotivora]